MCEMLPRALLPTLVLCAYACAQTTTDSATPLRLTLQDALLRAEKYSPQTLTANLSALVAREDAVQAKAALLPQVNAISQFIYTQPNGTGSGVFVPNDGPRIYNDQAYFHADIFNPAKRADWFKAQAAEAAARARIGLAARGLIATVTQNYYAMAVAARKLKNAELALNDAQSFVDVTDKLEKGGEAARSDTVKARLTLNDRRRDLQEAQLTLDKARIGFAVLLFPDYQTNFTVVDDLDDLAKLPGYDEIQKLAGNNSPDIRAAQATITQQEFELKSAHADMLPTLSMDYWFGISANQFAIRNPDGQNLLGSVVAAQVTVPVWTWGATRSRIRQAEYKLQQAKNDLSFTQRNLLSELDSFYKEAALARGQLTLLRESVDLAKQSLDLTLLRYQAGEVTVLEVVDAQSSARDARNALDDALARYRMAVGNLQTLTGAF